MPAKPVNLDAIDQKLQSELDPSKEWKARQASIARILQKRNQGKPLSDREAGMLEEYTDILGLGNIPAHAKTGEPMPRFYTSERAAATAHAINLDLLRKAKRQGCSAFKSTRIYNVKLARWLADYAATQQTPTGTPAAGPPATTQANRETHGELGAPGALRRLEDAERDSHAAYLETLNDPSAAGEERQSAHAAWLRNTRELLRFDSELDTNARDSGERLTRAEAANASRGFLAWMLAGIADALHNATPYLTKAATPRDAAAIWQPRLYESIARAIDTARKNRLIPPWMADAVEEQLGDLAVEPSPADAPPAPMRPKRRHPKPKKPKRKPTKRQAPAAP